MVGDQELGSSMNDILLINLENPLKLCLLSYIVFLWVVLQVQEEGYESSLTLRDHYSITGT